MTSIRIYDLTGRDDRRPSPFCWRIKYALAHKGLPFEAVPVALTDIPTLCGGGHKAVPIIEDGSKSVSDSWAIADYLDEAYPDRPRLFSSRAERELCRFVEISLFLSAGTDLFRIYVKDIYDLVLEKDRDYFRKTREARLGRTLEEAYAGREARLDAARAGFESFRLTLQKGGPFLSGGGGPFLSGERPGYADYIVGGFLLWIGSVATVPLLRADDPLLAWFERVRDLHGGLGRTSPMNPIAA